MQDEIQIGMTVASIAPHVREDERFVVRQILPEHTVDSGRVIPETAYCLGVEGRDKEGRLVLHGFRAFYVSDLVPADGKVRGLRARRRGRR